MLVCTIRFTRKTTSATLSSPCHRQKKKITKSFAWIHVLVEEQRSYTTKSDETLFTFGEKRLVAPCKVIQDSIRFWIPRCGFRIPGAGFRILPLQIPDSKTQKIPDFSFWFAPNFHISFSRNDFNGGFRYWRTCLWMHVCLFIFP